MQWATYNAVATVISANFTLVIAHAACLLALSDVVWLMQGCQQQTLQLLCLRLPGAIWTLWLDMIVLSPAALGLVALRCLIMSMKEQQNPAVVGSPFLSLYMIGKPVSVQQA